MKTSVPQVRAFGDVRREMIRLLEEASAKGDQRSVDEAFKKVLRLFEEEFKPKAQHPRYAAFVKRVGLQLEKAEASFHRRK